MATTKITTNSLADSAVTSAKLADASVTSAKLASSISIGTLTITSGISGNVAFDTNTLFVDSVNNRVGINTVSPSHKFEIKSSGQDTDVFVVTHSSSTSSLFRISQWNTNIGVMTMYDGGGTAIHRLRTSGDSYFNASGNVGIGTTTPSARLHAISTTEQLRIGYDASNYLSATVSITGLVTLTATGASAGVVFGNTARPTAPNVTGTPLSSSLITANDSLILQAMQTASVFHSPLTAGGFAGAGASASRSGSTATGWGRTYVCARDLLSTNFSGAATIRSNVPMAIAVMGVFDPTQGSAQTELTAGRVRLVVGDVLLNGTPVGYGKDPALTARGFGFEVYYSNANARTEIRLFAHDGTTYVTGTGAAFNPLYSSVESSIVLCHDGIGNLRLFANIVARGSHYPSILTELTGCALSGAPTGTTLYTGNCIGLISINQGTNAPTAGTDALGGMIRARVITGQTIT